jgi:hypothetical protein
METKDVRLQTLLEKIKKENTDSYNYIIPMIFSKKLMDYDSIRNDLVHVIDATKNLLYLRRKNSGNLTLRTCLWHSIIITYGKCFTDASKSKRTKLEISSIFKKEDEVNRMTHTKLMELRHGYIAHRGDNENDISVVFLKVPKKEEMDFKSSQYRIKSLRSASPTYNELENYLRLFESVLDVVKDKLQKQGEKTHKGYMRIIRTIPLLPKYTCI